MQFCTILDHWYAGLYDKYMVKVEKTSLESSGENGTATHFNQVNVPLLEILNTFFIRDKSS